MTHSSMILPVFAALAISVSNLAPVATAQTPKKCRAAHNRSANLISDLRRFVSATDANTVVERDNIMHLPVVATNQVTLVTDERVCTKVVTAYGTVPNPYTPAQLYVVKMGSKGFVAFDPDHNGGEFAMVFVFNTHFVRTGGWVSG